MLTLIQHCSHKLQPLDLTVFGPLKANYNAGVNLWLMQNSSMPMMIYQVAECTAEAYT
jgi:hypothetical protein